VLAGTNAETKDADDAMSSVVDFILNILINWAMGMLSKPHLRAETGLRFRGQNENVRR
jgi:hypothetical protein